MDIDIDLNIQIPEMYIIHDIRTPSNFKGITICGYKRSDCVKAFENCIINNNLEDALRWCVELHSTGLNVNIWNSIKNIYLKYIHINNPKLFFYILKREKEYHIILNKYPKKHEIFTRNNQEIRNLFSELTAITTLTKKNNLFLPKSLPTINHKSFIKENIQNRMISKDLYKMNPYIYNSTSNEIRLALNEIINNLVSYHGTFENCIYWYLWIEKMNSLNKNIFKQSEHWITILWKILLDIVLDEPKSNTFIKKLYNEYILKFKLSQINKKKYYIFIVFYTIKNKIKWNTNILYKEHLIIQSNSNINLMYEYIIQNIESELSPESKNTLYKKYNKLYLTILNEKETINNPIKIKNTNLNENINKIIFSTNPSFKQQEQEYEYEEEEEYEDDNDNDNNNNLDYLEKDIIYEHQTQPENLKKKSLISTNKTKNDVEENKINIQNKKFEAFSNIIVYKKKNENNKHKIIENSEETKNISFDKNNKNFFKKNSSKYDLKKI
jgi:hypothetical protein